VTTRALASLAVLVEYAAPLLAPDGVLVAWKGRRDPVEEAAGAAAAAEVGMEAPKPTLVPETAGAVRHLYLSRKVGPTPAGFPRRAGSARKRPLGS
jgi:16S rRNA (guanine527-N7)-methyltransferase